MSCYSRPLSSANRSDRRVWTSPVTITPVSRADWTVSDSWCSRSVTSSTSSLLIQFLLRVCDSTPTGPISSPPRGLLEVPLSYLKVVRPGYPRVSLSFTVSRSLISGSRLGIRQENGASPVCHPTPPPSRDLEGQSVSGTFRSETFGEPSRCTPVRPPVIHVRSGKVSSSVTDLLSDRSPVGLKVRVRVCSVGSVSSCTPFGVPFRKTSHLPLGREDETSGVGVSGMCLGGCDVGRVSRGFTNTERSGSGQWSQNPFGILQKFK